MGSEDITSEKDGGIIKYLIQKSTAKCSRTCEEGDCAYYLHQTRFDNGKLVDITETRRAADKFNISDKKGQEYLRTAFKTMKKGENPPGQPAKIDNPRGSLFK